MQYAVLFDMDGVLVDSYNAHFESWLVVCGERGLTMTESQFATTFGRTTRAVVAELWGADRFTASELAELDDRKEALYRQSLERHFPAMDGALELLDALAAASVPLAIGSSAPPENVWLSLDRLGRRNLFGSVVTGADVQRGKPDPEVFLLCASALRVPPDSCVVIEDAPPGVAAARAAGMKCVGMASRGRTCEQLAQADRVVTSLRQLSPAMLSALARGAGF